MSEPPSARCTALGAGELRNPWRCELSYPTGCRIDYRVTVAADGSFVGQATALLAPVRRPFAGTITGCCVAVP